jgi:hypothetical protein
MVYATVTSSTEVKYLAVKMCDIYPRWGAFTMKRNGRSIYVPVHMNNIARYSTDDFWNWFTEVRHQGNPFSLELALDDLRLFEAHRKSLSQQDGL